MVCSLKGSIVSTHLGLSLVVLSHTEMGEGVLERVETCLGAVASKVPCGFPL